ncbi:MAG: hypothetical protein IBX62_04525 [Coriobacteriia bacterium]|nr:hypothetical protein [Coriobacteriia bacterium]
MAASMGGRTARLVSVSLAALALAALLAAATPASAVVIDTSGQVEWAKCDMCHANISETKNYSNEIIFGHGLHILVQCSSCHGQFPHRPEGTERPTMKMCFNCHGLQHGPMGELATGKCEDCHVTPKQRLRPSFHTFDWSGKPHVAPSNQELQTRCMMCHDDKHCDDCHASEGIRWKPDKPYVYDPQAGCMACHAEEGLSKTVGGQPKSFQVTGVDQSAHRDRSCIECHPDFRYEERTDSTKLWAVNAGLACQGCHDHAEQKDLYQQSVHGQKLMAGDMGSATCSSCHGGHYIRRLDTQAAKDELHGAAYRICARCHRAQWDSYDDYYHGAAYKRGNRDAPSCWDCHGAHEVLPTSDPNSLTNEGQLVATCGGVGGREGCHKGSGESFVEGAKSLIHQKVEARKTNALQQAIDRIKSWL